MLFPIDRSSSETSTTHFDASRISLPTPQILYHFNQFEQNPEILKKKEPRSAIGGEKRGQTLFFGPPVTRDIRID
jgi:hypothetical protein